MAAGLALLEGGGFVLFCYMIHLGQRATAFVVCLGKVVDGVVRIWHRVL